MPLTFDAVEAVRVLTTRDPRLGKLIQRIGPYTVEPSRRLNPFTALFRSIIYQQLSGKAAATIHQRVRDLFPGPSIKPQQVLAISDTSLRTAGMSRAKVAAVNDLAQKAMDGQVPTAALLRKMPDADIVERLTKVRGIGEWTVQMLLIFELGRADVLPTKDLGVRRGYMITYELDVLPEHKWLTMRCEKWRPYRSVGSWYMWRATDTIGF